MLSQSLKLLNILYIHAYTHLPLSATAHQFAAVVEHLAQGTLSRRKAAQELDIGYATLKRLIDAHPAAGQQRGRCFTTLADKVVY